MQKEPVTVMGMEVLCCIMLMKTELLMNEINSTQKAFCGSKQGNFNDMNDTILEFVLRQMK